MSQLFHNARFSVQMQLWTIRKSKLNESNVDALTLSNLLVGWGGNNAKVPKAKKIEEGCVNPKRLEIPEMWREKMMLGEVEQFKFVQGDPPPFYDLNATDYVGKPIGLKELLYRPGLWKDGMTRHGGEKKKKSTAAVVDDG